MNERIKELDKQARLWAIDNTNFPISSHIPPGYTQKFAELIVAECAAIVEAQKESLCDDESAWHDRDYGYEQAVNDSVDMIKQHFGVEE